jgi:hypothetical protein
MFRACCASAVVGTTVVKKAALNTSANPKTNLIMISSPAGLEILPKCVVQFNRDALRVAAAS